MVKLNLSDDKYAREQAGFFNNFTKADLESAFARVITALRKEKQIDYGDSNVAMVKKMKSALSAGLSKLLKAELTSLMGSFAVDFHNFVQVLELLPKDRLVWEELMKRPYIPIPEIKDITGSELKIYATNSWNAKIMLEMSYQFFTLNNPSGYGYYYSDKKDMYLTISPAARKILIPWILPQEDYVMKTLPDSTVFPEDFALQTFEENISADIAYLAGLEACGQLVKWPGGSLPQARLNSVAKKMKTRHFGYDCHDISRVAMLTLAYANYVIRTGNSRSKKGSNLNSVKDFANFVKDWFGTMLESSDFQTFFPEYRGFTKGFTEHNNANLLFKIAFSLIEAPEGEWIDMSTIVQRYLFENAGTYASKGFVSLFIPRSLRDHSLRSATETNIYGQKTSLKLRDWEDLTRTFFLRIYKLLTACGLTEMMVEKECAANDVLEGMRYIRLTPLGRYATGATGTYVAKVCEDRGPVFEFDDRNSIITLLDQASPYGIYLDKIGRRIGGNRFHISAASILQSSEDKDDAERRLETFTTYICPNPQGHWLEIVEEARKRMDIHSPQETRYYFYALKPDVPGLIDFVATNREISEHSLKAENNCLLVEADFDDDFHKLLHKAGYLS